HPRVLRQRLPADEAEPSSRTQGGVQVGEGGDRVDEEHDAEAREADVEVPGLEARRLGVGRPEGDVADPIGALARAGEHRRREVDARDRASETDATGELDRRITCAAADVEDALARPDADPLHRRPSQRPDLLVEDVLQGDPLRTGGLVPVDDLLGVRALGVHRPLLARASSSMHFSTNDVQPVWWLAPQPRPFSPWKYS